MTVAPPQVRHIERQEGELSGKRGDGRLQQVNLGRSTCRSYETRVFETLPILQLLGGDEKALHSLPKMKGPTMSLSQETCRPFHDAGDRWSQGLRAGG